MSSPFPLLLVPHVVFREILKSMDFVEIINLSRCSQKSKSIVRDNLFRLKDWKICVAVNKGLFLRKGNWEECCILDVSSFDTQPINPYYVGYTSVPNTESDCKLMEATEYVMYLFKSEIHTIQFGHGSTWLMNQMNELGKKIPKIVFDTPEDNDLDDNDFVYVLMDSCAEELEISGYPLLTDFGGFGNFDSFFQSYPYWMTIEHLISMECSRIFLPFTALKNADLNRFLRHFVNGGSPQWEFMNIGVDNINEEEILSGLEEYVRRTDNKRKYEWKGDINEFIDETYTFYGLEIVTKNGARASLDFRIKGQLSVRSEFRMTVSPRS